MKKHLTNFLPAKKKILCNTLEEGSREGGNEGRRRVGGGREGEREE